MKKAERKINPPHERIQGYFVYFLVLCFFLYNIFIRYSLTCFTLVGFYNLSLVCFSFNLVVFFTENLNIKTVSFLYKNTFPGNLTFYSWAQFPYVGHKTLLLLSLLFLVPNLPSFFSSIKISSLCAIKFPCALFKRFARAKGENPRCAQSESSPCAKQRTPPLFLVLGREREPLPCSGRDSTPLPVYLLVGERLRCRKSKKNKKKTRKRKINMVSL